MSTQCHEDIIQCSTIWGNFELQTIVGSGGIDGWAATSGIYHPSGFESANLFYDVKPDEG